MREDKAFVEIDDFGGGTARQGRRWYPEDMVLAPDVYLQGIDEVQRGKDLAVEKWLELESEGWMRCGFGAPTERLSNKN